VLEYTINGFANDEEVYKSEEFQRKMKLLGGIEANFEYEMHGIVSTWHDEFKNYKCVVKVNPLAGENYEDFSKGYVGNGWLNKFYRFLFWLYITPQMAKNIIERQLLADQIVNDDASETESKYWMAIRMDVVNYRYIDDLGDGDKIAYSISRVYC